MQRPTVLIDGKTQTTAFSPADANSVTGKLLVPATGKVTAILALTAGGKPAQVKFIVLARQAGPGSAQRGPRRLRRPRQRTPAAPAPGMPGNGMAMSASRAEMQRRMDVMDEAMMGAPMTGNPDQDLAGMMMPHHQAAIDMARIHLRDGKDPAVRRMAQRIISHQGREISEFKARQVKRLAPAG